MILLIMPDTVFLFLVKKDMIFLFTLPIMKFLFT